MTAVYKAEEIPSIEGCEKRDQIFGRVEPIDIQDFLKRAAATDRMMDFNRDSLVASLPLRSEATLEKPPPEFAFSMPSALRLDAITLAYDKASIIGQAPVRIQTAPQQWTYAASIPILLDRTPQAKRLVHLRGRVLQGQIGIGILNRKTNTFQVEKFLNPF